MTLMQKFALLALAGLAIAPSALSQETSPPAKLKALPNILAPEHQYLLKRGEFDRARSLCSSRVRDTALVTEPGTLAGPFLCLGEALYGLKKYKDAAVAFNSSVEQLTDSVGLFDPRLVQPLEGLGKTLMRMGKLEEAEGVLSQAKDLTHRNFGIYNLEQSSIVNRLTRAYFENGELVKATREQKFLFRANEEAYGEAPQLLPALRRMAKWNERIGRSDLARNNYRRALDIMERAYGPDDLRRIGPLRDYANSYLNTPRGGDRVMSGAGARALVEIVNLYERQEFSDAIDVAKAWAKLGDWYVIGGRRRLALRAYSEAGKRLEEAGSTNGDDTNLFSQPVEIEYEEVPIGIRPSRIESFPDGVSFIEYEFTVTETGRVMNLVVVRDDLNYPRFAIEVGQRVKASRYRPRIVEGVPVATTGVRKVFRYDFSKKTRSGVTGATDSNAEQASQDFATDDETKVGSDGENSKPEDAVESSDTASVEDTDVQKETK